MANKWACLTDKERDLILASLPRTSPLRKKIEGLSKRITVASAKGKGRRLEQWVCEQVSKLIGIPYIPNNDSSLIAYRNMGQAGVDIILRGEALQRFPFSVECKAQEMLNLVDSINQAKSNIYKDTDWLLVHKKKALSSPIVIMDWETFAKIIGGLLEKKGHSG